MNTESSSRADLLYPNTETDSYEDPSYCRSQLDFVEDLELYTVNGLPPIHLGDKFKDDKYHVIHKLGFGGYSTVWLARDLLSNKYVAIKFVVAEVSANYRGLSGLQALASTLAPHPRSDFEPVAPLLDQFWMESPNGRHLCLVLPILGPSISQLSHLATRIQPDFSRKISLQATKALAYLHSLGMCHGDFTSANVLLELSVSFQDLTEDEVYTAIGEPKRDPVIPYSEEEALGPEAPKYVVDIPDWSRITWKLLSGKISIIDYDQSFPADSPPGDKMLGTPVKYLSPEAMLELSPSKSSDIWALGCLLFKARAGWDLFEVFGEPSPDDTLHEIERAIGMLPPKWADVPFDNEGMPLHGKSIEEGKKPDRKWALEHPIRDRILSIKDRRDSTPGRQSISAALPSRKRTRNGEAKHNGKESLSSSREVGVVYEDKDSPPFWKIPYELAGVYYADLGEGIEHIRQAQAEFFQPISQEEAESLHDLLSKIFVYDPRSRPSAEEIAKHPWFVGEW